MEYTCPMVGGDLNWMALPVPIYLGAVLTEAWVQHRRQTGNYAFGTAMSDMATGTVFQALELFLKLATLGVYAWIYDRWALVQWREDSVAPWIIAFVGVDLLFYWWHRASHVVNVLWAVHGVHHQSEDFNLAVALRQPALEPITWFVFYGVLAFAGVSPLQYMAAYAANRFYQFWIHTELVARMPRPIEWLLNTPSHHRVHHGVNEEYLDKNYGAILIVWDRLFGSFEREDVHPTYGTTVPLQSYNPIVANVSYFRRIAALARTARLRSQALWAPFAHPTWLPDGLDPDPDTPRRMSEPKYRPPTSRSTTIYVGVHFVLLGNLLFPFLLYEARWSHLELAVGSVAIITSSVAFLGLVEGRPWAWPLEIFRLAIVCAAIALIGGTVVGIVWANLAAVIVAVAFAMGLWRYQAAESA